MPKDVCFVIETERGIVVTSKPEYIVFHQRKTNESITTFTKFVKEIMFGHICKLVRRNRHLMDRVNTYCGIALEQNKQIEIFQEILKV